MNKNSFFKELKRRNVYRVAITYGAVAWLVAQVVSLACTTFNAPDWIMQMVLIALIAGFPIAVVLAWAFEMSADGMVRTSPASNETKPHPEHKKKPLTSNLFIGFLLLVIAGQFVYGKFFAKTETNISPMENSTISTENRQKRIAVLSFDNQTTISELGSFGNMLSDWITRGLMETESANVVNSANLQHIFKETDTGEQYTAEFAAKRGIDLLLQGRYYLVEGRLIVTAEILDMTSGQVVETFQVEGDRDASMNLLDLISDNIMSYWAVKDHVQFAQNPPKFAAYEEYLKGLSLYTVNAQEAIGHMQAAFRIDSSFFPPLLRAWALYSNLGQVDKSLEIQNYLIDKKALFTKFESLHFESIVAVQEHRYFDGARSNFQKYELDPSDMQANFNAAVMYISANYPKRALETLADYDMRLLSEQEGIVSWRVTLQAFAYYCLGNYAAVQTLINDHVFARMPHALADFHMLALIRMDSSRLIPYYYQKYTEEGVFGFTGMKVTNDQLLVNICSELMITSKNDLLLVYAQKLKDWESRNEVIDIPHDQTDIFNNMPFRQEEARGYAHFFLGEWEDAIKTWSAESIPKTNWPDILERASRLGHCYAALGDTVRANLQLQQIDSIELDHAELQIQKSYYKSRIFAALGHHDEAIHQLKQSIDSGLSFFRIFSLDRDPFLLSILESPSFQTLIHPKE